MTSLPILNYFNRDHADPRDVWLNGAKKQGHVPQRCLQLGTNVAFAVGAKVDPCAPCGCPREKCGGREPTLLKALGLR